MQTACSVSEDDPWQPTETDKDRVEIKLSAGGSMTRASVESDVNGLFEADGLGIFMLATDVQDIHNGAPDITWTSNDVAVPLINIEANAQKDDVHHCTNIEWADGGPDHYYYPFINWYRYRFFGYYPRVDDSQVQLTSTRCTVTYELDGETDVIWGQSKLGSDDSENPNYDAFNEYRYSASYFRQPGCSEKYPELTFSHELMRMKFSIMGADASSANIYRVERIIIMDVPQTAVLVVADLDDNSQNGSIACDWDNNLTDLDVSLTMDTQVEGTTEKNVSAEPLLLPVPDPSHHYTARVVLRNIYTSEERSKDITITPSSSYEKGKSYSVKLRISGPGESPARTVIAWDDEND